MKSFQLTSPYVNSGKLDLNWKDISCQETFLILEVQADENLPAAISWKRGQQVQQQNKKQIIYVFFFFRVVYNSNERSVDFCPIADIDSNSTVLVSISTSSPSSVPVSSSFLTSSHHNLMILTVYISELAEHMYFWLLCSKHSFAQQISLCGNHSKSRGR